MPLRTAGWRKFPLILTLVLLSGCTSRELLTEIQPTYTSINRIVVQPKCVSCHESMGTYEGLKPMVNDFYEEVLEGGMPLQSAPLSTAEVQAIKTWIDNGALNN